MKIKVKFFASLLRLVGHDELEMGFKEGTTIDLVLEKLMMDYPELEKSMNFTLVSLNHKYAHGDEILKDGDELALLPPIAGG